MSKLPDFEPVTQEELRRIWAENPCPEARRLVLEIERYRRVLEEVEGHFESIHAAWRREVGGGMVALHMCKTRLSNERSRVYRPKK